MPALDQDARHQQPSMTVPGIFFSAHERYAKFRHAALQPFDPGYEPRVGGNPAVEHVPIAIVVFFVARPATQFPAKKKISDSCRIQRALENLTIELGCITGVGRGPDIHQNLDCMLRKQFRQQLESV